MVLRRATFVVRSTGKGLVVERSGVLIQDEVHHFLGEAESAGVGGLCSSSEVSGDEACSLNWC